MKNYILENLLNTEGLDFVMLLLNNAVAVILAFFVMFVYKFTYSGTAYSKKFSISLGMMVIITTSIMCVISNNIALSLGMVGALSIIRFRTAVKDVRDAVFIFWSIAVGIGCGVSQFALVLVGSLVLFLFLLMTRQIVPDDRKLLIVRGLLVQQPYVESVITSHFGKAARQMVVTASAGSFELVYGVSCPDLKKANERNNGSILQKLTVVEGVTSVNLIDQTDDIAR